MEGYIPAEVVRETWQQVANSELDHAHELVAELQKEQPFILLYLTDMEGTPFNQNESEIIFFLGLVIWQIMKKGSNKLRQVTVQKLMKAEDANYEFLDLLSQDTEGDFESATLNMLESYQEPEVLRYVVEAIMEEPDEDDPEDEPIRDENRGLAFVIIKTVLDAFLLSRGKK